MAWDLTIAGVSKKSAVMTSVGVAIRLESSERSTARFQIRRVASYLPARFDEVLIYDKTATLMYGGIVMDREVDALVATNHNVQIACADWWTYLDWSLITLTYTAPVTTKTILTDLIAALPGSYGFTLAAGQVNGLTYDAYASGVDAKASDILRGLAKDLGYRPSVSPAKVIEVVAPGTVSAPFSVTTATPHCQIARWRDPSGTPANRIVLRCGPSGVGDPVNYIWTGNAGHVYALDGVGLPASSVWPGIVTVAAVQYPIWPPGSGPTDRIEWDYALNGGTLTFIGAAASIDTVGASIGLNYSPQFPFTVVADAAMTPVISEVYADESIIVYEQGVTRAAAILAERNQAAARELMVVSRDDGWRPDQTVTVALTQLDFAGDCTIGAVDITITADDRAEVKDWVYQFTAVETDIVPGSTLDVWRQILGTSGTGTAATTIVGGGGSGGGGMIALPSGQIYVGNAGNVATAVAMSGDATIDNAGVVTVTGGSGGMTTLPTNQIYVGNGSNVATAVAMSGDITIVSSGATDISAGVIVNADINASAAIVDTKLATISTAGKVSNSATTATSANTPNTIVLRDGSGDFIAHAGVFTQLSSPAATDLSVLPTSNVLIGATGQYTLPSVGYTQNIGAITQKFLTLHAAELWVETLVAQNTLATIGGRVVVAPTNILTRDLLATDFTGSYPTQTAAMYVKYATFRLHVPGVELGSKILMESNGKFETYAVIDTTTPTVSGSGDYGYTVYRNQDNTGTNDWYAGDACLDTGKVGDGFIDLYSLRGVAASGYGPAIVGNVRTNIGYADFEPRWAIGNLRNLYGYSADIYGSAFGVPTGAWIKIDPTNGVRIGYNATVFTQINAGTATFSGDGNGVTNINGGNIQTGTVTATQISADTITSAQIAANSILAGDINVSGFSDNLIKNGTFEPPPGLAIGSAEALSGWSQDQSTGTAVLINAVTGVNGPGTMYVDPGNGFFMSAVTQAIPVRPGDVYRFAVQVFANVSSSVALHVLMYEYNVASGGVRYVRNPGWSATSPDVLASSYTFLATNAPVSSGWQSLEYIYTVPSGVLYVSPGFYNLSGSVSGSTQTPMHFDDVSMMRQLGTGSISANAITAAKIAANTITAGQIASGTITATQIAANTITAGQIASGTITATEIAANTITAAKIAAGTITATEIASNAITTAKIDAGAITTAKIDAGAVTASEINVSTLSAISANLGTITAGTISGTTFYAGGTDVVMDSNGLTLAHGGFTAAKVKWTDGSFVVSGSNTININATSGFAITTAGFNLSYMGGSGDCYVYVDNGGTLRQGASYP